MSRVLTLPTVGVQGNDEILSTMPGPRRHPGLDVILSKATAWYSARDIASTTQQSLPNRVNPSADPAVFGSVRGAEITPDGVEFGPLLPTGTHLSTAMTPYSATAASMRYTVRVRLPSWGPSGQTYLMGSSSTHTQFVVRTSGALMLARYDLGNAHFLGGSDSPIAVPAEAAGEWVWLRAELVFASGETTFEYSLDATDNVGEVAWISLGASTGIAEDGATVLTSSGIRYVGTASSGIAPQPQATRVAIYEFSDTVGDAEVHCYGHPRGTQSLEDDQGNTWALSISGADTNDPAQLPHDGDYVRSDGSNRSRWEIAGLLPNPGLTATHTVVYDLGPAAYTHTNGSTYQCPGGTMRSSVDTGAMVYCSASSVRAFGGDGTTSFDTGIVAEAPRRFIKVELRVGEGLFLELSDDGVVWDEVDSDLGDVQIPAEDFELVYGVVPYTPSTNPWGSGFKSMEVYNDDVLIARIDPGRDGDGLATFTDPISGLELTFTDGGDLTYISAPQAEFDGTDDFIQLPASDTPGATHTVITAYQLTSAASADGNSEFLFSAESATDDGAALYHYGVSGQALALLGEGGTKANSVGASSAPEDTWSAAGYVATPTDIAFFASWNGLEPPTAFAGTPTFGTPRWGGRSHVVAGALGGPSGELIVFDGVALTEAEANAVSAYLLAGAA